MRRNCSLVYNFNNRPKNINTDNIGLPIRDTDKRALNTYEGTI